MSTQTTFSKRTSRAPPAPRAVVLIFKLVLILSRAPPLRGGVIYRPRSARLTASLHYSPCHDN
ncbi:hypothetical protein PR001_g22809 [Phytophthora rubi]|uniref:Uncharacterized protein n=1 Tax=Phytophthora rubi TaxID=129364 RepID=A0A6A3IUL9_9STRA|nr:hypothetical protein PR001_g22809 [Phytophthora rubi]